MDTSVRNTRSRKVSESSDSEDRKVKDPESQVSKRVTKGDKDISNDMYSKHGPSPDKCANIETKLSQPTTSPSRDVHSQKEITKEFKEPLPISSPRTRRTTQSESVDGSEQEIKTCFDKG